MLAEVTVSATAAEKVKSEVQKVKDRAQKIVDEIEEDKKIAELKLEAAKPALQEAEDALKVKKNLLLYFGILITTKCKLLGIKIICLFLLDILWLVAYSVTLFCHSDIPSFHPSVILSLFTFQSLSQQPLHTLNLNLIYGCVIYM